MTIIFPDCSEYSGNIPSGYPFGWARATIGDAMDRTYATSIAGAIARKQAYGAYHFLNSGHLGVSAASQARFAYGVIGPGVPTFLDIEPNRGYCATVEEAITWIGVFRGLGGIVHLHYTPHWSWKDDMGSPDLTRLQNLGVSLISSYYTTYSDNGPGWASYGGVTPVQWQFTNNLNGTGHDGNAYRGTIEEYIQLITGGIVTDVVLHGPDPYDSGADQAAYLRDMYYATVRTTPVPRQGDSSIASRVARIEDAVNQLINRPAVSMTADDMATLATTIATQVTTAIKGAAGGSLHVTGDLTLS